MAKTKTPAEKAEQKLKKVQGAGNLYSHSQLTTFRDCHFRWYGAYALGFKDAANFHTAYGTLFHAVASRAVEAQLAGTLPAETSGLAPWIAEVRKRYADVQALVPVGADEALATMALAAAAALPDGAESVQTESVLLQPLPAVRGQQLGSMDVAALEASLLKENDKDAYFGVLNALEATGANGIQVRPDAAVFLHGAVVLRDWKTNAKNPRKPLDDLVGTYTPQVRLYAAVGRRRWPDREVHGDLHFLEYGKPVAVGVSKGDLDATARAAVDMMGAIAHAAAQGPGGFPKQVGEACHYCQLAKMKLDGRPVCPEGAEYRKAKGWDKYDEQDALARIQAGIEWAGDEDYRTKLVAKGEEIAKADAAAVGESNDVDPITAEVATWTPEIAEGVARGVQDMERYAEQAKEYRPFLQRYVELRGPIALPPDGKYGLPGGTWGTTGGKTTTVWTDDVAAIEATVTAAGLDQSDYLRRQINPTVLAKVAPEVMDVLVVALEAALKAAGVDAAPFIRRIPNTAAFNEALKKPDVFELLKTLRVEETSARTLRFTKDKSPEPKAAKPESRAAAAPSGQSESAAAEPAQDAGARVVAEAASLLDQHAAAALELVHAQAS